MKFPKLLASLFFVTTLVLGYLYYTAVSNKGEKPTVNDFNKKCSTCMAYNDVIPSNTLDLNLVKTMAYDYQSNPANNGKTRSIWMSLSKLKQFVYQVESKTCKCEGELGVRIYNGAYPVASDWSIFRTDLINSGFENEIMSKYRGNNEYSLINTIVMIPTINIKGKNLDFDPSSPENCKGGYAETYGNMRNDSLEKNRYKPTYTRQEFGTSVTALMATNHGDACPPLPNGSKKCPDEGAFFDY